MPIAPLIWLFIWLALGMFIYFGYSRHHSVMRKYTADEAHAMGAAPVGAAPRPKDQQDQK